MDRGTYNAASGGLVQLRKLELVNNNLANVNTPGFKRQFLVTEAQRFDDTFAQAIEGEDPFARGDHERTPGAVNPRSVIDFSPGPIKSTGNKLDVALRSPNDFFVVQTPAGLEYTRAGNFTLSSDGTLVTQDGMSVQGDGGPITANAAGVSIEEDGSLRAGGVPVGKLQVMRFSSTEGLEATGGGRFRLRAGTQPETVDPEVVPESLEMANVSVVTSMIDLISATRAFELYSRSAQGIDQLNQTAISQIGRRNA